MKKMKLNLDQLKVESFKMAEKKLQNGTVNGFGRESVDQCDTEGCSGNVECNTYYCWQSDTCNRVECYGTNDPLCDISAHISYQVPCP